MKRPTIVTGQQIGLLGGPLYTTYKVLGAVYHAEALNGQAVYWLETNDADFNEINHIDYLDGAGRLQRLTWEKDTEGYSCGYIKIDGELVKLLETYFATIRQTGFTSALKTMVMDCYEEGKTLEKASVELAKHLYGFAGLLYFTPFAEEFRGFSQGILRREAWRTDVGGQCNCFCMVGKKRVGLFRREHGFELRDGTPVNIEAYELVPNVQTRSVCQDGYFNTSMYIAGPGEVKYLERMAGQYEAHGIEPAQVQSRMSITLIEPRVKRILGKLNWLMEDVLVLSRDELVKKVMVEKAQFNFAEVLERGNRLVEGFLRDLGDLGLQLEELKPLRKGVQQEFKEAVGKWRAREKEKHQRLLNDVAFLVDNVLPMGKPQERVFNIVYYLNLFGPGFIPWLLAQYHPDRKVLEIEAH